MPHKRVFLPIYWLILGIFMHIMVNYVNSFCNSLFLFKMLVFPFQINYYLYFEVNSLFGGDRALINELLNYIAPG